MRWDDLFLPYLSIMIIEFIDDKLIDWLIFNHLMIISLLLLLELKLVWLELVEVLKEKRREIWKDGLEYSDQLTIPFPFLHKYGQNNTKERKKRNLERIQKSSLTIEENEKVGKYQLIFIQLFQTTANHHSWPHPHHPPLHPYHDLLYNEGY